MEFKSQICTTVEQSKRLLALGLKKETADMVHCAYGVDGGTAIRPFCWLSFSEVDMENFIPAWSLHRLLCLYGVDYTIKEVYNNAEECYGMLICAIEIAIKDDYFNKDYLEEKK